MSAADPSIGPHVDPPVGPTPQLSAEQMIGETTSQVRRETFRQVLRSKTVWIGITVCLIWTACALFGMRIAPQDPYKTNPIGKHKAPSVDHYFGTDLLGRDIFSRVIVGARDILLIAPLATLLGTVLGTALGLAMGYFRGWTDDILSRIVEAVLALPLVIIAITALAATGTSTATLIGVIGFVFAPIIARTVRAAVLSERELEYVAAARLRGERNSYILFF
jgi:peptide/nickel transport system permease protein